MASGAAGSRRSLAVTSAAVAAVALAGSISAVRGMGWYDRLDKPSWQPPKQAFGLVWTPLYGLLAVVGARVLVRSSGPDRRSFAWAYAVNLAVNGAWTPLFFGAQAPGWALADIVLLDLSTVDLVRRARRSDPGAAVALVPYLAWVTFATALNAEIVRRNRHSGKTGRWRR